MAKRLLAMVACEVTHESPWFNARGTEHCAKVTGLNTDDEVTLVDELDGIPIQLTDLQSGLNVIKLVGQKFKIRKSSGNKPVPTTVEVFY